MALKNPEGDVNMPMCSKSTYKNFVSYIIENRELSKTRHIIRCLLSER
jgi:hypothetical protein